MTTTDYEEMTPLQQILYDLELKRSAGISEDIRVKEISCVLLLCKKCDNILAGPVRNTPAAIRAIGETKGQAACKWCAQKDSSEKVLTCSEQSG